MGAPPPRVAVLGPRRQRQGAGSAPARAGKVPRAGAPECRPAWRRNPADRASRPLGDPARGCSRGEVRPASPKGRALPAAGSLASGALLSSRVPRIDSGWRRSPERLGWAETVQPPPPPGEVAQRGLPKVTRSAQAELPRPLRVESREGEAHAARLPPSCGSLPPSPLVRTWLHWRC